LRTPKLLAHNRRSLCIDPVHLKNMLRQVQSDRSNLAHGWLPFAADSITAVWHSDAARGPSTPSFDHLVGGHEQLVRHSEAKQPRSRSVDDPLELARLHHRQVLGLGALEDAPGVDADLTIRIQNIRAVAHQPADFDKLALAIHCR